MDNYERLAKARSIVEKADKVVKNARLELDKAKLARDEADAAYGKELRSVLLDLGVEPTRIQQYLYD